MEKKIVQDKWRKIISQSIDRGVRLVKRAISRRLKINIWVGHGHEFSRRPDASSFVVTLMVNINYRTQPDVYANYIDFLTALAEQLGQCIDKITFCYWTGGVAENLSLFARVLRPDAVIEDWAVSSIRVGESSTEENKYFHRWLKFYKEIDQVLRPYCPSLVLPFSRELLQSEQKTEDGKKISKHVKKDASCFPWSSEMGRRTYQHFKFI